MFIILLAQFNSVYNAILVLLAVVLSTTGVAKPLFCPNCSATAVANGNTVDEPTIRI